MKLIGFDHDAHVAVWAPPWLVRPVANSATGTHVRSQNQPVRERDEKVFAPGFDLIYGPPGNRRVNVHTRESGKHGFEPGDRAARQRTVERAGRAEDRVPFWHGLRMWLVVGGGGW